MEIERPSLKCLRLRGAAPPVQKGVLQPVELGLPRMTLPAAELTTTYEPRDMACICRRSFVQQGVGNDSSQHQCRHLDNVGIDR